MIRVVLLGRTGNNLFQYALGRVLATKHDVPLVMDASWFNQQGWREVSHFLSLPLKAKIVRRCSLATRVLRNLAGKHYWEYLGLPIVKEEVVDQTFDPTILTSPADCLIFGYFQSPLYFADMADLLRAELNGIFSEIIGISPALRSRLSSPSSIAVHVRRGDYLLNPVFDVCNRSYYENGMNQLRERIPGAHFYIFSDDPAWCRSELKSTDVEVIDSGSRAKNPLFDLHLMSLASHHLIANSSYSWWGAWLGLKPSQIVMIPDRWYAAGTNAPIEEKRLSHWEILYR